jgi:Fe-S cluster assembly ATPase SufC
VTASHVKPTYQGIQQPHSGLEVAHLDRVEKEAYRDTNENDGIIQIDHLATDLMEVQIHEQT